jgi:predicted neuraminidase
MFEARFIYDDFPGRPRCHCAALTELADGDLLAVWYAGEGEGLPDSALLTSRFSRPDGHWTRPEVIVDTPGLSDGNAILFTAAPDRLWLFHTVIQGGGWASVLTYWRQSDNGGLTWTMSRPFDPEPGLMFRCRPLRLPSGRVLIPMYDDKDGTSLFFHTDDEGATWRRSRRLRVAGDQCIQPAPVLRADGSLLAYMRCGSRAGHIWQSVSNDGGETWSPCEPVALPNPNAGVDMIRLQTGELLLAANLTTNSRSPLHLALSEDEGASWPWRLIAAHDPGQEFSYPQLLQAGDGACHLLYTWRRERIRHLAFDVEWLKKEAGRQREHVRAV